MGRGLSGWFSDGMMTEKNLLELLEKLIQVISSTKNEGLRNGTFRTEEIKGQENTLNILRD